MLKISFVAAPSRAEGLAVGLRPGGALPDLGRAAATALLLGRTLARRHSFKGEEGDVLPVLTADHWLVLVGLGPIEQQNSRRLRRVGGGLFAELATSGIAKLDVAFGLDPLEAAELAYGMLLRAWRPAARYRSKADPDQVWSLSKIAIVSPDPSLSQRRLDRLAAVAAGSAYARDLVVAPGNELTPQSFIDRLDRLTRQGISLDVLDAATHGLRLLQAVGQGSAVPPRLALLHWRGAGKTERPLVFVGKGITFDTGGIDIKPRADMEEMKGDMAGAAAVAGALYALALRRAPVNAVGVLALAENMPSGQATRPGDVVASYAGTTVEIIDTDAEGRLVLADALAYAAAKYRPRAMVDLATLTGAVEVALGRHRAGLFTADDQLAERLMAAGEAEDELLWRLPLTDAYDDALKSLAADLRNCDWEHGPDALHAARFLQHFVPDGVAWAHLDIAGLSEAEEDGPLAAEGPTGFGVRLLDRLAEDLAAHPWSKGAGVPSV